MKEDRIHETAGHSVHPESYVAELRRPAGVIAFPARSAPLASPETCERLAETALEYARAGEGERARQVAIDALTIATSLTTGEASVNIGRAMLLAGDTFVVLIEMVRAVECFDLAANAFDGAADLAGGARARFGLSKAMRELHDPGARAVLEDAGSLFEEIGDQATVLMIDRLLREMKADFEESPQSFHSSSRILRASAARCSKD